MDDIGPQGKRVVVTGGGGFVGHHLVDALAAYNDVTVLDDFSNGRRERLPEGVTVHEGDVCDPEAVTRAVEGADVVFHEAAVVSVERSVEDPEATHAVNVDATLSVLSAAREADARVVFASSAAVYGTPEHVPVAETAPKEPVSPYGLEKLSADHYCRLFAELYGVETVALRYFNVYGPGQSKGPYSGVITAFVDQARGGGPVTVQGDGEQTRDFVHVSDVVRANLLAATTEHVGEAFNVGTGRAVTVRRLAEAVRDSVDSSVDIETGDARAGDVRHSRADITKARERLGYEPTVDLEEGIRTVVET